MIYVEEADILGRFSTMILLKNRTKLRHGSYLIRKSNCPMCQRPIGEDEEVSFTKEVGFCFQCAHPDGPLAFCKKTLVRPVFPNRVARVKELCTLIDPKSEFRDSYNHRSGRISVHWSFSMVTAFLRIGFEAFRLDKMREDEVPEALQRTIKLGSGGGACRMSSSSLSSMKEQMGLISTSGPKSSLQTTTPQTSFAIN